MTEQANRIHIVINTLQDLDIKSTFDNMNRLMGALHELARIRDELSNQEQGPMIDLFEDREKQTSEKEGDKIHE